MCVCVCVCEDVLKRAGLWFVVKPHISVGKGVQCIEECLYGKHSPKALCYDKGTKWPLPNQFWPNS